MPRKATHKKKTKKKRTRNIPLTSRRLDNDPYFDEIALVSPVGKTLIQMQIIERYKTSGLSGDEWRHGAGWFEAIRQPELTAFYTGYHDLESATKALYPGLFKSHQEWHKMMVASVDFRAKGKLLYRSTYGEEGEVRALPMLHCVGHLPWAMILAFESGCIEPLALDVCHQPGCARPSVSVYRLVHLYQGWTRTAAQDTNAQGNVTHNYARAFCRIHLQRGDCGLEDADSNYTLVKGTLGPDDAQGHEEFIKESIFGGYVDIDGEVS